MLPSSTSNDNLLLLCWHCSQIEMSQSSYHCYCWRMWLRKWSWNLRITSCKNTTERVMFWVSELNIQLVNYKMYWLYEFRYCLLQENIAGKHYLQFKKIILLDKTFTTAKSYIFRLTGKMKNQWFECFLCKYHTLQLHRKHVPV